MHISKVTDPRVGAVLKDNASIDAREEDLYVPSLGTSSGNVTSFKDSFRKVEMTLGISSNSAMVRRVDMYVWR